MMLQSNRHPAGDEISRHAASEPTRGEKERNHGDGPTTATDARIEYPSGDGKPMAETEVHLEDMIDTIQRSSGSIATS